MSNIIQILSKGNLELFHSAMIAQLFNDDQSRISEEFKSKFLSEVNSEFDLDLDFSNLTAYTEFRDGKNRYDIYLIVDGVKIVIENKFKSIGIASQIEKYLQSDNVNYVVSLNLLNQIEVNKLPINKCLSIDYEFILGAIPKSETIENTNLWSSIYKEYRHYLQSELSRLKDFISLGQRWDNNRFIEYQERYFNVDVDENSRRFILQAYLSVLSNQLIKRKWVINKNQSSGVWISDYKDSKTLKLKNEVSGYIWNHIEIHPNVFYKKAFNANVGIISLRASTDGSNLDFYESIINSLNPNHKLKLAKRPSLKSNSFYVFKKIIKLEEVSFESIIRKFDEFENINAGNTAPPSTG